MRLGETGPPGGASAAGPSPGPLAPRADPIAAAALLIAGAIGIWQLLLPWRTAPLAAALNAGSSGAASSGSAEVSGWQVYRALRAIPDPDGDLRAAMFSVLGVAVGGGALIVLGLAMMTPINHRPLGFSALLISLLSVLGACWMLIRARAIFDVGLFTLFAQAQAGWYLFLAAGVVGIIGSWKAIATG